MEKINNRMKDVENGLQFTIVIAMFFPVVMQALFNSIQIPEDKISVTILGSGASISILIINYLFLRMYKQKLHIKTLKILDFVYMLTIFCYAMTILLITLSTNEKFQELFLLKPIFTLTFYGSLYLPIFAIIIFLSNSLIRRIK